MENRLAALENVTGVLFDRRVPRKRVSMRKIQEVLRLHFDLKLPQRQIARAAKLSQSTVHEYLRRFEESGRDESEPLHKCAVCGATEQTNPELDFRVARNGEEYCVPHLPVA